MFHNNKKTDAVAEAVKKILEVSESVESVEEDMHKPLLPKQKEVQKKVDAETKRQNPPKKQAGTIAASVGAMRKEEKSFKDRLIETFKQKEKPEELLPDLEEEMSDAQKKKREEIVMSMKDKTSYFKKKYGARWKNVMYATATKQAMGEQIVWDEYVAEAHDDEEEDKKLIDKEMKAHNADTDSHKPAIKKMVKKDCLKSEEVDQYDEEEHAGHLGHAARQAAKSGKKMFTLGGKTFPVKVKAVKENNERHTHAAHYEDPKTGEWTGMKLIAATDDKDAIEQAHKNCEDGCRLSKVERHIPVKKEVEQVDEMDKSQPSSSRGAEGLPTGTKAYAEKYKNVKKTALNALRKAYDKKNVKEEVELDEGYSAHTHTVHFCDPESGEWKGKMLIVADNDNEAVDLAHQMASDNNLKVMKVSKNHLVMMDRTMGEEIENEEEIIFEAPEQDIDDEDITTDMLRGRVAGGKVNSFKNFKVKLKSDREYQRPPTEKDSVPAATAARASVQAKKWDPPYNVKTEEVEQIDEKKGKMILVVPKKPDPKTGRKDVKKIPAHMWPQMKDTHYQAEEVELDEDTVKQGTARFHTNMIKHHTAIIRRSSKLPLRPTESGKNPLVYHKDQLAQHKALLKTAGTNEEVELGEGKDPSMDAGVGSEPSFVQNANPSSNPSPKHTPMSKAKELASKTITKIKADLGRR